MECWFAAGDVVWQWVDADAGVIGGFDDPFSRVAGLVAATRPRIQRSMEARSAAGDVAWHWVDADEGDIGGIVDLFSGVVWAARSPLRGCDQEGDIGGIVELLRRVV